MKINRDNFEAYFLDYHEGQLSPDMVDEVLLFVKMNPDLEAMFSEFEAITLASDDNIEFEHKSVIRKQQVFATSLVNEMNYEEMLISETEGLLNPNQITSLDEFISINPQFEKDRRLYASTHLAIETDITFAAKESLKQKAIAAGPINAKTFETYMAREIEGDLTADEKLLFNEFMLYNPHLIKDRELYKHTILKVDTDLVFENKNKLKRTGMPIRRLVFYALSAAASLALFISVFTLFKRNEMPNNLAQQTKTINHSIQPQGVQSDIPARTKSDGITNSNLLIPATKGVEAKHGNKEATIENVVVLASTELASADRTNIEPVQARTTQGISSRQYVDPQFIFIRVSQMYMNENREFYYNLKLAEEIQYAEINKKDKNPGRTILNAATGKAEDVFASNHNAEEKSSKGNLSFWTFAELGIQTFNTVTSSDVELKLRKDDEGKVISYGIEGGLIDFEKAVKH